MWGYHNILDRLRFIFRGHELPDDARPEDILFFVEEITANSKTILYRPTEVRFLGPGAENDHDYRLQRITVEYALTQDGRKVIEDISVG